MKVRMTTEGYRLSQRCRKKVVVANRDSKQSLGFEEPQSWTPRSVERTAPVAMLLYSLVVLWFAREGHRDWRPAYRPWYPSKAEASFADMLALLQRQSVKRQVSAWALGGRGSRKVQKLLENVIALAA